VKDPQLLENQIIVPIDDGSANRRYTVNSPVTVNESPKIAPRVTPGLGEHTDQVPQEIGFKASRSKAFGRVARSRASEVEEQDLRFRMNRGKRIMSSNISKPKLTKPGS